MSPPSVAVKAKPVLQTRKDQDGAKVKAAKKVEAEQPKTKDDAKERKTKKDQDGPRSRRSKMRKPSRTRAAVLIRPTLLPPALVVVVVLSQASRCSALPNTFWRRAKSNLLVMSGTATATATSFRSTRQHQRRREE